MSVQSAVKSTVIERAVNHSRRRFNSLPYLLAMPVLLYETVFVLIPILQQIVSSFTSDVFGAASAVRWVGLVNYNRMFADASFWKAMGTTLTYMVCIVVLSVGIGLLSATLLNANVRGRSIARAAVTLPWAFPEVPTVLVFLWIFNPSFGVINVIPQLLGIETNPRWLIDVNLAMPSVISIAVWKAFPFYSLVLLAAMQTIPHELYEAARVDGANPIRLFRHITLPSLTPTIALLCVLAAIFAFRQFALIWLTSGGGPGGATETLVIRIYNTAFRFFDFSYGATLGVAGFVTVFVITVIFVVLQRRRAAAEEQ
jgi:multiple sugar transport system permease protein